MLGTVEQRILRRVLAESPISVRLILSFDANAPPLWDGVVHVLMCGDGSKIDLIHQIPPLLKFLLIDVIVLLLEVVHQ